MNTKRKTISRFEILLFSYVIYAYLGSAQGILTGKQMFFYMQKALAHVFDSACSKFQLYLLFVKKRASLV